MGEPSHRANVVGEMSSADNQDYCQPGLGVTGGGKKYPTCFAK